MSAFGIETSSRVTGQSLRGDGNVVANANSESADDSFRGAGAGMLLGCQHQFESGIVFGAEADWGWLRQKGRQETYVMGGNPWIGLTQASILRDTQWMSTERLRLALPR